VNPVLKRQVLLKQNYSSSTNVLNSLYYPNSCHLIDKAYYDRHPEEIDDENNNRSALSVGVHEWYIGGKRVTVPLFKLTVFSKSETPFIEGTRFRSWRLHLTTNVLECCFLACMITT
jgi:hypothetical protein